MAGTAGKLRTGVYRVVVGSDPTACAAVMRLAGTVAALVVLAFPGASSALGIDFTTPSRNIGCAGDSTFVRCDIARTNAKTSAEAPLLPLRLGKRVPARPARPPATP